MWKCALITNFDFKIVLSLGKRIGKCHQCQSSFHWILLRPSCCVIYIHFRSSFGVVNRWTLSHAENEKGMHWCVLSAFQLCNVLIRFLIVPGVRPRWKTFLTPSNWLYMENGRLKCYFTTSRITTMNGPRTLPNPELRMEATTPTHHALVVLSSHLTNSTTRLKRRKMKHTCTGDEQQEHYPH
jgi:hypothetical protein